MMAPPRLQHFIGDEWRATSGDHWIPHVNASERTDVVAEVPEGTAEDVALAVTAARQALDGWRSLGRPARAQFLPGSAAVIGERTEVLAKLFSREVSKPSGEARGEVLVDAHTEGADGALMPHFRGTAFVTGETRLHFDARDPFRFGIGTAARHGTASA